jgi:small-conductance mechanosensitive channel
MELLLLWLQDGAEKEAAQPGWVQKVFFSVAWLLLIVLLRSFALRILRGKEWGSEEESMRWRMRTVNLALLFLLLGILIVWFHELQAAALWSVALVAAIVLAAKELIVCVSGGVLRTASNSFSIGDRIEIGGLRGDVIEYGLLTTTIMEVGPSQRRTGRAVTIPNSMLMTQPVVNESFTDEYVLHSFELTLKPDEDWQEAERVLLRTARKVCEADLQVAERHMRRLAGKHGLAPSTVEPRVSLRVTDESAVRLLVRVPTAARNKGRTEQTIVRAFLEHMRPTKSGRAGEAQEEEEEEAEPGSRRPAP